MNESNRFEFWRMNAFTDRPFTGNPAAVVPDADGLDEETMRQIAPELNSISETVYITRPDDPAADFALRYFTSTTEVDLCGHATIAALFVLAAMERIGGETGRETVRAQTRVGVLSLGLKFRGGEIQSASMKQLATRTATPSRPERIPDVLGVPGGKIRQDLPIGCSHTGIWACYVPLVDRDALHAVETRNELIEGIWPEEPELAGIYPYVITGDEDAPAEIHTQGRFFSPPQYGIREDPVTGTACGALGGWLMEQGLLDREGSLFATQGVEMGRAGTVRVQKHPDGAMVISGKAVAVLRGSILLNN